MRLILTCFTSDLWEGYVTAVEEFIAAHEDVTAYLVIDRFHVAQQYRDDFADLRKAEFKQMTKTLPPQTYDQDCKGTLWPLRHHQADLDDDEKAHLQRLFAYAPQLHQTYTLGEELTALFHTSQTPLQAEPLRQGWIQKVQNSSLTCYDAFSCQPPEFALSLNCFLNSHRQR